MTFRSLTLIALCTLSACTDFPEVDAASTASSRDTALPTLSPMADILAAASQPAGADAAASGLATRLLRLKARAEILRQQ